jgi:hypothetical protein
MAANCRQKRVGKKMATEELAGTAAEPQLDSNEIYASWWQHEGVETDGPGRTWTASERMPKASKQKPRLSPWEICYQVNLAFQQKISGQWQCVACNRTGNAARPEYRSNFVTLVATCPDGHKDHLSSSSAIAAQIICYRCDEDFALRLSQEKVKCFHGDCHRILVVDGELVRWAGDGDEWQEIFKQ